MGTSGDTILGLESQLFVVLWWLAVLNRGPLTHKDFLSKGAPKLQSIYLKFFSSPVD